MVGGLHGACVHLFHASPTQAHAETLNRLCVCALDH
jgi:hypothetical protein